MFLLSPFSFSFSFCFRLSFCLLYTAIHDLWNIAFFSRKTSASINLFCRALHLLFKAFGKPSELKNPFKLSAIISNNLFSGSRPEKYVLCIKHKFSIIGFGFPFLKISENSIYLLQLILYFLKWYKLDWINITEMTNSN